MPDPETIAVRSGTLQLLLARCTAALPPKVPWSEAKQRMDDAAHLACRDALGEIRSELEDILGIRHSPEQS